MEKWGRNSKSGTGKGVLGETARNNTICPYQISANGKNMGLRPERKMSRTTISGVNEIGGNRFAEVTNNERRAGTDGLAEVHQQSGRGF
jgi:hypothetical protein